MKLDFFKLLDADPATQLQVRELRNEPNVRRFMYTDHIISEQEHQQWIESLRQNERTVVWVIVAGGNPCGVVSLNNISTRHKTADWAFYLTDTMQGKGVGVLVEYWLIEQAFNEFGLEKLNSEVLATNPLVVQLHQRFGFHEEGIRRSNIIKEEGRIDVVLLGLLKNEWEVKKKRFQTLLGLWGEFSLT